MEAVGVLGAEVALGATRVVTTARRVEEVEVETSDLEAGDEVVALVLVVALPLFAGAECCGETETGCSEVSRCD